MGNKQGNEMADIKFIRIFTTLHTFVSAFLVPCRSANWRFLHILRTNLL